MGPPSDFESRTQGEDGSLAGVTGDAEYSFDVFLSHASEDKDDVRVLARQLESAGLKVWLDEEQLPPGFDPQQAISRGLRESRHVLVWVSQAWLDKSWTRWEARAFSKAVEGRDRRIVPLLRESLDDELLGPYLTGGIPIGADVDEHERAWLAVCGLNGVGPGKREDWARRGRDLSRGEDEPSAEEVIDRSESMASVLPKLASAHEKSTIPEATAAQLVVEKPVEDHPRPTRRVLLLGGAVVLIGLGGSAWAAWRNRQGDDSNGESPASVPRSPVESDGTVPRVTSHDEADGQAAIEDEASSTSGGVLPPPPSRLRDSWIEELQLAVDSGKQVYIEASAPRCGPIEYAMVASNELGQRARDKFIELGGDPEAASVISKGWLEAKAESCSRDAYGIVIVYSNH